VKSHHIGDIRQADDPRLRTSLPDLDQSDLNQSDPDQSEKNVLSFAVSDDALEISAGSSAEGAPTLAAGSYCFTCPTTFE
jgi:hypothetical protein